MRGIRWLGAIVAIVGLVLIAGIAARGTAIGSPGYPPAGSEDRVDELCFTDFLLDIDLDGTPEFSAGPVCFSGPAQVVRGDPYDSGGFQTIDTEIVSMELTGFVLVSIFTVRAGVDQGLAPSTGQIQEQTAATDFPADSFFDIFHETDTGVAFGVLESCGGSPTPVEDVINAIPTYGAEYHTVGNAPIDSCLKAGQDPQLGTPGVVRTRGLNPVITVGPNFGPPVVGGIAGLLDDADTPAQGSASSADDYAAAIATGVVAGAVALAVGGWYARRRWLS